LGGNIPFNALMLVDHLFLSVMEIKRGMSLNDKHHLERLQTPLGTDGKYTLESMASTPWNS
jgi:hypothetical protein